MAVAEWPLGTPMSLPSWSKAKKKTQKKPRDDEIIADRSC